MCGREPGALSHRKNPEGMEAGCLLSKDRSLFLILLPFHPFFFRPLQAFFLVKSCFESNVSERRPNLGGLDKVGDGKVVDCEGVGGASSETHKKTPKNSTSGQEKDSNCTSLKCTGLRVCRLMSVVLRVNRITEGW